MKKILAIALAVAMVLSMASASAFFCDGIVWTDETKTVKCALPTIEVVEMVRSNALCGYDFVESGCAAVVAGMPVYFAVKLTVPADVNPEWWAKAAAYLKTSNTAVYATPGTKVERAYTQLAVLTTDGDAKDADNKYLGEGTYWLTNVAVNVNDATDVVTGAAAPALTGATATKWTKVNNDFTFGQKNVFFATAFSSAAKICAKVESDSFTGVNSWINTGDYTIGFIGVDASETVTDFIVTNGTYAAKVELTKGNGKVNTIKVVGGYDVTVDANDTPAEVDALIDAVAAANSKLYVGYDSDAASFKVLDGTVYTSEQMGCNEAKYVKDIMGVFGFDFGTPITYSAVKKIFGFGGSDDAVVSCSDYKVGTSAIVDAACEIEIPKTGDVSVIAYAVMAIVAAAGAMGLKK